jgi:hypothetical protein
MYETATNTYDVNKKTFKAINLIINVYMNLPMLLPSGGMRYSTLYSLSQFSKNALSSSLLNLFLITILVFANKERSIVKNEREVAAQTFGEYYGKGQDSKKIKFFTLL